MKEKKRGRCRGGKGGGLFDSPRGGKGGKVVGWYLIRLEA